MPDISIVIPVYNAAPYLRCCIDSVLQQSFTNFELICVDDHSTDSSSEILQEYAQKDSRLRILSNVVNLGEGTTRNVGIAQATGRYLLSADADDYLEAGALDALYAAAQQYGSEIVVGGLRHVDPQGRERGLFMPPVTMQNFSPLEYPEYSLYSSGYHVTMLFDMHFLKKYELRYRDACITSPDAFLLFSMLKYVSKMTFINSVVVNYRFVSTSVSKKCRSADFYKDNFSVHNLLYSDNSERALIYADARVSYRLDELLYSDCTFFFTNMSKDAVMQSFSTIGAFLRANAVFPRILFNKYVNCSCFEAMYQLAFFAALQQGDIDYAFDIMHVCNSSVSNIDATQSPLLRSRFVHSCRFHFLFWMRLKKWMKKKLSPFVG